jgi:hypothetical protein
MKIPLRPSLLRIRRKTGFIVLHHTSELYELPEARIDTATYQLPAMFKGVMEKKQGDINYHYVIEQIKEDYIPIACRPFVYMCDFKDIESSVNNRAIHIALLGNYDFKIPERRLYEVLAYRLINPMLKMFHISPNRIKFHSEVSSNKELTCPGEFVNKEVIISMVRRFVIK